MLIWNARARRPRPGRTPRSGSRARRRRRMTRRTAGMSDGSTPAAERVGHQALGEAEQERVLVLEQRGAQPGRRRPSACRRRASPLASTGTLVVLDAPPAGDVEVLERQAERVDHPVARGARRVLAVLLHPLAHRQQLAAAGAARSPRAPARWAAAAAAASRAAPPSPTCRAAPARCDRRPRSAVSTLPWPRMPRAVLGHGDAPELRCR